MFGDLRKYFEDILRRIIDMKLEEHSIKVKN